MRKKICESPECRAEFTPRSPRQKFCTKKCRITHGQKQVKNLRLAENRRRKRRCKICGRVLPAKNWSYCSQCKEIYWALSSFVLEDPEQIQYV